MKLSSVLMIISTVGMLLSLPTGQARADDNPPTYVRKGKFEIVPCVAKEGMPSVFDNRKKCRDMMDAGMEEGRPDVFMFDRTSLDRMLTISGSEEDCRKDLAGCRKVEAKGYGWNPLSVILVAGGTVIVVGGVAFLVGYFIGK